MAIRVWFKLLWHTVSNRHIEKDMDWLQVVRIQLMNQYAFIISLIFVVDALRNLLFARYTNFSILLIIGCVLFLLSQYTKIYFNGRIAASVLAAATLMVFYFCSTGGVHNGITLYYFAILFAGLFVFVEKIHPYSIFVFLWISTLFYIVSLSDGQFLGDFSGNQIYYHTSQGAVFIQVMLLLAVNVYFIMQKHNALQNICFQTLEQDHVHIEKLSSQLPLSSPPTEVEVTSVADVVKLAKEDSIAFIPLFKQTFPDFYKNLVQVNPEMTREEFKFCAMLKLGFTTKDIANYQHLAVRSVQTKKNRLRKSFCIPKGTDLYAWVNGL